MRERKRKREIIGDDQPRKIDKENLGTSSKDERHPRPTRVCMRACNMFRFLDLSIFSCATRERACVCIRVRVCVHVCVYVVTTLSRKEERINGS